MFHWICPECGREIAPAVKECPACDPKSVLIRPAAKSLENGSVAVETPVAVAAVLPPPLPVEPALVSAIATHTVPAAAPPPVETLAQAEPVSAELPQAELPTLEILAVTPVPPEFAALAAASEEPRPVETPQVEPPVETSKLEAQPPPIGTLEYQVETTVEPQSAIPQAEPPVEPLPEVPKVETPVEPLRVEAAADEVPRIQPPKVENRTRRSRPEAHARAVPRLLVDAPPESLPEPLEDSLLAIAEQIRAAQQAALAPPPPPPAEPETVGLPELAAAVGVSEAPSAEAPVPEPAILPNEPTAASQVESTGAVESAQAVALLAPPEPEPLQPKAVEPQQVEPQQALSLPSVPESSPAAEAPAPQALAPQAPEPSLEILPPQVSRDLSAPPPEPSVDRPPSGSWLQLAPLQNYSSPASRSIQPAAPRAQILTPDSGPRMTLPGPALPPALARLQEANPVTVLGEQARPRRRGMPGWLVSLLLMIGIPVAGAALLLYFQPISHPSADAKPPATQPDGRSSATTPPSAPLAQLVEVTGFRIVIDFNKKSEIHYLVVNHSPADLSDMTVFVTLRMANAKPGQPPLSRFSFRAPSLGPFESKEMISPIERLARSLSLPEWQDLRAEVQVAQ